MEITRSPQFFWASPYSTNTVSYKGNEYRMIVSIVSIENAHIQLHENNITIYSCYSNDDTFKEYVDSSTSLREQILEFGEIIVESFTLECPICEKQRVVFELDDSLKVTESLDYLCYQCEDLFFEDLDYEEDVNDEENWMEELQQNPPKILGGVSKKIDALSVLLSLEDYNDVDTLEDGYVYAKGIIQTHDSTYYPVFLTISLRDGGEHCGTDFIADNWKNPIPDTYAEPFLGKERSQIYPYTYSTIEHIEGDFHQDIWLGQYRENYIKSHLVNFVEETRVRPYFSIQHLQAAAHLTRRSGELEKSFVSYDSNMIFTEHRAYVTSAILSAVAFLESTINEIISDARENPLQGVVSDLGEDVIKLINQMVDNDILKLPILKKYQTILALSGREPFDKGRKLFQEVALVIKLRNNLVHYEPKSILVDGDVSYNHLRDKFLLNPFAGENNPFFPDQCLSYGCAKWTVETVLNLTDEFFDRMKLMPLYYRYRRNVKIMIDVTNNYMGG